MKVRKNETITWLTNGEAAKREGEKTENLLAVCYIHSSKHSDIGHGKW